jgi:hypothetical protein
MRKLDIEKVISQGSVRQKIKLCFVDVAHFNVIGKYTAELKDSGDNTTLEVKNQILTDRERELIYSSVKEPKDVKYWNELRTWNKSFLMFMPIVTNYRSEFQFLRADLSKLTSIRLLHRSYQDAINNILEDVEDANLREVMVTTALNSFKEADKQLQTDTIDPERKTKYLKKYKAQRYQEEGYLPYLNIPDTNTDSQVLSIIEKLNDKIPEAKDYISGLTAFLNKQLPLQPYKDFLKEEETKIIEEIETCRMFIEEGYIIGRNVETSPDKPKTPPRRKGKTVLVKRITKKDPAGELPDERFNILRWEDVEVETTETDIENIKNAGR